MKKNKFFLKGLLALTIMAFLGCDDSLQKADQDVEGVIGEEAKPNVSASISTTSVNEAGAPEVLITVQLDKPVNFDMPFTAVYAGGTASNADFSANSVTIPAYSTQGVVKVTITDDILPESTETLDLEVTPDGIPYIYEAKGRPVVSLDIDNNATDNFTFILDWDTDYVGTDGDTHSTCDFDFDIEVYTASFGGPVATSYSSCPEQVTFSPGDLADGDYWLVPSIWTYTSGVEPASNFDVPATFTFAKEGVWLENVDSNGYWNTGEVGAQEGNGAAYLVKYILTVAGNTYTVTDSDSGSVIGTGRMTQPNVTIPTKFVGGRQ